MNTENKAVTGERTAARKIIAWNTGRTYTAQGQRIAAVQIGSGVFFSDQDRGIHAFLSDCELSRAAVMHRYDHNIAVDWSIPDKTINRWELIAELDQASKEVEGRI